MKQTFVPPACFHPKVVKEPSFPRSAFVNFIIEFAYFLDSQLNTESTIFSAAEHPLRNFETGAFNLGIKYFLEMGTNETKNLSYSNKLC